MKIKVQSRDRRHPAGLKLRKINKGTLALAVMGLAASGVGLKALSNMPKSTSATTEDMVKMEDALIVNPAYEQYLEDLANGKGGEYELIPNQYISAPNNARQKQLSIRATTSNLPTSYNLVDEGYGTKIKNQGFDGNCWAQAITTAMESNLSKTKTITTELSPKQMDYLFAKGTPHAEYVKEALNLLPFNLHSLGDGYNFALATYGFLSGLTPVEEAGFFEKMKQNDSTLADFDDFSEYNDYQVAHELEYVLQRKNYGPYTKAMNYDDVTGVENKYMIGEYVYDDYMQIEDLNIVKQSILNNGATFVATVAPDTDGCFDADTKTVIDLGSDVCGASNGHAMAIVGWDDNHTYTNPSDGSVKQGAFILQNSWGTSDLYERYDITYENLVKQGIFDPTLYTEEQAQNIKDVINDTIDNFDAYEFVYLAYDRDAASMTSIGTLETILNGADYSDIYEVTMGEGFEGSELIAANVVEFTYNTGSKLQNISQIALNELRTGYDTHYVISIDAGNGYIEVADLEIPDHASQKLITLKTPIEVKGQFKMKVALSTVDDDTPIFIGSLHKGYFSLAALAAKDELRTPDEEPTPEPTVEPEPTPIPGDDTEEPSNTGKIEWKDGNDIYIVGIDSDLTVKIDYPLDSLELVMIDDEELAKEYYDLTSGSTIITLHGTYLDTLESGTHKLAAIFDNDRKVEAEFEVLNEDIAIPDTSADEPVSPKASTPNTGINTKDEKGIESIINIILPISIIMAAVAGYGISRSKKHVTFRK